MLNINVMNMLANFLCGLVVYFVVTWQKLVVSDSEFGIVEDRTREIICVL